MSRPAHRIIRPAIVLALALLPAVAVASPAGTIRLPGSYRTWTVKQDGTKTSISQFHLPLVVTAGLGRGTDLVISGSGAFASVDPPAASSTSLNGMTDVTAQLFMRFAGDRFLIHAGAGLPTGKTELDQGEIAVARDLALPVLGFRAKDYGEGLNLSAGGAAAFPLSGTARFALGAGVVHRGSYTLIAGGGDYRPAPEVSATAGLDLRGRANGSPAPLLRLDAVYRIYGKDELDGKTIFEEGNQIELQAAGSSGGSGLQVDGLARTVLKADNTVTGTEGQTVEALKASSGNALLARLRADLPVGTALRVGLASEWNHVSGSDTPTWNGDSYGLGPVLRASLGPRTRLELNVMRLGGTLDGGASPDLELSGTSFGVTFSWRAS
jgi:hypothetical protein